VDIDRLGEEYRRLIRNEDFALGVGQLMVSGTVYGLVLADINIISFF